MRRLVVVIVLAVMELVLFPLVELGIVPPWPAGYLMLGGIAGMGIIAITLV